jgi:hypothetical protein
MNMAWTIARAWTSLRPRQRGARLTMFNPVSMKEIAMNKTILISIALLTLGSAPSFAQSAATPQEKLACRNDAASLCPEHIGKPAEMNACLAANKAKLSEPCRKVVEAHGG